MIKKNIAALVLILVAASLLRVHQSQALASASVAPGESIQTAINNASPGDTILIESGIHEVKVTVVIDKTVTLVGDTSGTTIIDGNGTTTQIFLVRADGVRISNLTIQNTSELFSGVSGVDLFNVRDVEISDCRIERCMQGIQLRNASSCDVLRSEVEDSHEYGIFLRENSSFNVIVGNTISGNPTGLIVADVNSSGNSIHHNNFINNIHQRGGLSIGGTWDNGYPSGGNYWSDHTSPDEKNGPAQNLNGSDGISDQPYNAGPDSYPLAGPMCLFNAGRWDSTDYYVAVASNSTLSDLYFNTSATLIRFSATGPDETVGFCRVAVPKQILWIENGGQWQVYANGTAVDPLVMDQYDDYTYLYFEYGQSTQLVEIKGSRAVPEFRAIGVLLFLTLLLAIAILERARAHNDRSSSRKPGLRKPLLNSV